MRRRRFTTASLLGLFGLLLAPGACKQSDSILLVEVAGPRSIVPSQLLVTVLAGPDSRAFRIPPTIIPGSVIPLPASFTLALDRSHTGPIRISIDALGEDGVSPLGFGITTQDHIQIGGQTVIAVMLQESLPPDMPDAGAGGTSGSGAGGSGGAGGASGSGAAGQDGGSDARGDALGLDSGTD